MMQVLVPALACLTLVITGRRLQAKEESAPLGHLKTSQLKEFASLLFAASPGVPSPALLSGHRQLREPHKLCISRSGRIVCGWGPDPIWSSLKVETIGDAADGGLKDITIKPPEETAEGYTTPGQYVQIREPGAEKAGFFAIASPPDAKPFEFLIKETPASDWSPGTGWLTGASPGTELEMSQVMGSGFKLAEHLDDVERVLLFAVGSGISPIRSVIESGTLKGKDVELYYGAQKPEKMAYRSKFDDWKEMGVDITPVISQPEGTDWSGETGYVQDVAEKAGAASKDPSKTAVLLCGMKGMSEGVKKLCAAAGIDEGRVLANF